LSRGLFGLESAAENWVCPPKEAAGKFGFVLALYPLRQVKIGFDLGLFWLCFSLVETSQYCYNHLLCNQLGSFPAF
jgi:hypothetical protein